MANLDQTTQQNAALVEKSAAAAQPLREQAGRLTTAMSAFNVSDRAQAVRVAAPATLVPVARPVAQKPPTAAARPTKPKMVSP